MNETSAPEKSTGKTRRRPATAAELLDLEEAFALNQIAQATQRAGEDVCTALELREKIRRHPFLATALGAVVGYLGGPPLLRSMSRMSALLVPALHSAVFGRTKSVFEPIRPISARILSKLRVSESLEDLPG